MQPLQIPKKVRSLDYKIEKIGNSGIFDSFIFAFFAAGICIALGGLALPICNEKLAIVNGGTDLKTCRRSKHNFSGHGRWRAFCSSAMHAIKTQAQFAALATNRS